MRRDKGYVGYCRFQPCQIHVKIAHIQFHVYHLTKSKVEVLEQARRDIFKSSGDKLMLCGERYLLSVLLIEKIRGYKSPLSDGTVE